jgi:hypothetical protein
MPSEENHMLANNPVDPGHAILIHYQGPAGPSTAFPRDDEGGLGNAVGLLAAAALLAIGYVIGGFAATTTPSVAAHVPATVPAGEVGSAAGRAGGAAAKGELAAPWLAAPYTPAP